MQVTGSISFVHMTIPKTNIVYALDFQKLRAQLLLFHNQNCSFLQVATRAHLSVMCAYGCTPKFSTGELKIFYPKSLCLRITLCWFLLKPFFWKTMTFK